MIVATDAGLYLLERLHPLESMEAELEHLEQLATVVLNEHTDQAGLCAICGAAFPCDSAILVERHVALL